MAINRRQFIGSAAATLAAPRLVLAQEPDGSDAADGGLQQTIILTPVDLHLLEGGQGHTIAWSYGDGPEPAVIRARQGDELKLRFVNTLQQATWLHFYGVRGPSDLMTLNIPPGEANAVDCAFVPPDAGTFWIGPMADQSRARDMGLYAMLIVEEAEPVAGLADLPLVLDDWRLDDDGAIEGNFGDIETMVGEGRLGNWFTVNSHFRPRLPLKTGVYTRLRLLNAANVRTMGVLFKGFDPLLIARDGQPVTPQPLDSKALELAPGQRADLLVSPEQGDIRMALDLFEDIAEIGYLAAVTPSTPAPIAENFQLPANPLSALGPIPAATTFAIRIEGGLKGGLKSAVFGGEERDLRTLLEYGKGWAFNGVAGPAVKPLFTVKRGDTVVLEVENRTAFRQPVHIHGHVWQELAETPTGKWQDTAVIAPNVMVTLTFVADNPGTWAIQSLVAERADGGLLAAFKVEPAQPEL